MEKEERKKKEKVGGGGKRGKEEEEEEKESPSYTQNIKICLQPQYSPQIPIYNYLLNFHLGVK